jgi:hypothetical protein
MKGKGYEERMEGFFPLSRMAAGGRIFGEEGNTLPSTSSMITGLEMLLPVKGRQMKTSSRT